MCYNTEKERQMLLQHEKDQLHYMALVKVEKALAKEREENAKKQASSFVVLLNGQILCDVDGDSFCGQKMIAIDDIQTTGILPKLFDNEYSAQFAASYWKICKGGKPMKFISFCTENDMDACEKCNSVYTDWDGASGESASGFQECSWLVCKACGHLGDSE